MSRLIDADELIKAIENHKTNVTSESVFANEIYTLAHEHIIDVITIQPIAFNTEKVVEQIHDKYCHKCRNILGKQSSEEYCKSVKCEIDALCDIVKKGGVE